MRRKKKFSRFTVRSKYLFIILSAVCVILLVVSFRYEQQFDSVRDAVASVFVPVQKGIKNAEEFVSDKIQYFSDMKDLIAENEQLKKDLEEKTAENNILLQEKYELENLRELYQLDQTYGDYPKVAARVISKNTTNWYNVFLIDKGTEDGIAVGMNVIAGNGLVGIVTQAGKNYSRVRSIIDDDTYVTGSFLKTKESCMIHGNLSLRDQGTMEMEVSMIDKNAEIEPGYEVVTSQISDQYLPGILIGYISEYSVDSSNMTMSGYIVPAVDFSNLETVLVITTLRDSEELNQFLNE